MTDQEKFEEFLARKFQAREAILKSTPAQKAMRVIAAAMGEPKQPKATKLELAVAAGYPFPRVAARLLSREVLEGQKK